VALGFGSKEPVQMGNVAVIPRDFLVAITDRLPKSAAKPADHKVLWVDVRGEKDGQLRDIRVEMICNPYTPWDMGTGPHSVGVPVGVTCRMLGSGIITQRGALPAEACVPPEPFFKLLAERNLHTAVMVKHFLNSESEEAQ
jgi:saccharopine dehydrogenase-like NADP-dependent oxidoreductase